MNKNQIEKGVKNAAGAYVNDERYSQLVSEAKLVKVSFKDLKNSTAMVANYAKAMNSLVVSLPFGNIIFDITGYPMTSMEDGELKTENFAIHIMPCVVAFKEHNLVSMVVTDIRLINKVMVSKSYIIYADMAGIHIMTAVDRASAANGCYCFRSNVFSSDPGIALQFLERMPGFASDSGFALPDCAGLKPGCAPVNASRAEMASLIKILLTYANLPANFFVRVDTKDKRKQEQYYVICDKAQWGVLKSGNNIGELNGNAFTDGSKLLEVMQEPIVALPNNVVVIGNKTYTPLAKDEDDKTGTSPENGEEGNGGNGTPLDISVPQDAP